MFGRDTEDIKFWKSTRFDMKNTLSGINRRLDTAEEKISKHEDRVTDTSHSSVNGLSMPIKKERFSDWTKKIIHWL